MTNTDYQPLDLAAHTSAPAALFQDPETLDTGRVTKFGIPFLVGAPGASDIEFTAVGGTYGDQEIVVDTTANWVIFAHATLDSQLFDGGDLGTAVASYDFVYDDGEVETVSIRERFEIAVTPRDRLDRPIPLDWGQSPFLAIPELEHVVPHRTHGRFDHAGGHVKEVQDPSTTLPYTLPYRFFLWTFRNPRPEVALRSIRLRGHGETVIVAGITLSHLDEVPFNRTTNRDVIITFPETSPVHDIEKLEVLVDRGTASFPYWVVAADDELAEPPLVPAWGQHWETVGRRRAHVRVTGNRSATVSIVSEGEDLVSFNWGELERAGTLETAEARFEIVHPDRSWVSVTVRDSHTGETLPCRVHFSSASGVPYPPHGHPPHINSELATFAFDLGGDVRLGNKTYAYIDGTCEGWLPVGEVIAELSHGFEYRPVMQRITIAPDQSELVLELDRTSRVRDSGYISGDTHGHFVSTMGAEFEASGEDLDIINLQRTQGGELFTATEEVRGRPHRAGNGLPIVNVGQENRTGIFGHINLLGVTKPIMPISTGGPDESEIGTGLDTTLSHWADECRAQGGAAVLAHFPVPNGEAATLIATDRLDALEMIAYDDYNVREYYRYLNHGYEIPLVGGSDKMTAEVPLGIIRSYVGVTDAENVDYFDWLRSLRKGDTFVSSGPLLRLTIDGERPGSHVRVQGGAARLRVELDTVFPVSQIEIMGRRGLVHTFDVDEITGNQVFEHSLDITEDTWITARAFSSGITGGKHHDVYNRLVAVHTSPVYLRIGDRYIVRDPSTQAYMLQLIDGAIGHIEQISRRFWPGSVNHRHRGDDHLEYLLRPFHEARAALESRD